MERNQINNFPKIACNFKNFFCPVAPNIQFNIKQTFKSIHHYLTNPCKESFLISLCTKTEIQEIISNFDNNKTTGINSIPLKILKLLKSQLQNTYVTYTISPL